MKKLARPKTDAAGTQTRARSAPPALDIAGIDHIYLAVSDFSRAEKFYDRLMEALGFKKSTAPIAGEPHRHYYNREFQISIRPAHSSARFNSYAPGLHHLCLRVSDNAAVDAVAERLRALGVETDGPRLCPEYAPDYYAVFFEDPDGIRFEVMNHIQRRQTMRARWNELEGFVDPLRRLLAKR
ncbi:MAG: VOC family protein [Candidatus Binataceae bacterium]